eukprot:NODE_17216_length_955_cov_4.411836.p1 GENE.NODE_17216_length_955_cov_4.411836~~NODE_17216_length_955_cov_4.411836.p1  ORF type:complete len:227 (+),score=64.69 NODE_17216_length_955_cov_4.411836:72-752(+)
MANFLFLPGGSAGSLEEPMISFLAGARAANAKLALMTFSSMLVARRQVLSCSVAMVTECGHNLRLIYVGKKQYDYIPASLEKKANALKAEGRLLEVEKADFGTLFKEMDCFIVHGGLGTTVEALRLRKPCVVTGPLLLDQRFWGNVCFEKGVGPKPVHIDHFQKSCVTFADGALDPEDPFGWQAAAQELTWGDETDDGVSTNVEFFESFMADWSTRSRAVTVTFAG